MNKIKEILGDSDYIENDLRNTSIKTNGKVEILIAEDNTINMKLLKTFIKSFLSDVSIHEAINGRKVLDILSREEMDLIFMDIQMPFMDGIETTRRIRAFDERIPIIGLTALTQTDDELKSKSIGMNDYIRKPVSKQKIFDTLNKWIDRK